MDKSTAPASVTAQCMKNPDVYYAPVVKVDNDMDILSSSCQASNKSRRSHVELFLNHIVVFREEW